MVEWLTLARNLQKKFLHLFYLLFFVPAISGLSFGFFSAKISFAKDPDPRERFPLSTSGRWIVDSGGQRFKLKSVNWWGASDRKQVVGGLDQQSISHIVGLIKEWGFNSVRLPFSNQMIHDSKPVQIDAIAANPQWMGMTPLQVYDQTVKSLTDAGIAVVLNNHTTTSEWCCNYDYNGLWHHQSVFYGVYNQTKEMWQNDWVFMANRYRDNPAVVGADLRNEVRTARLADTYLPNWPNWGLGGDNDWHKAAENAGNAIHQINPNLLIVVEGINWRGIVKLFHCMPDVWAGFRPVLAPVRDLPVRLNVSNKLVYSAHQYAFTGPRHTGDRKTSGTFSTYSELDVQSWKSTTESEWGFVLESGRTYTAPVWLSEFGAPPGDGNPQGQAWFGRLTDYLVLNDIDFAFWPLNGNDSWGLVSSDWSQIQNKDWRYPHLRKLLDSK
jgi:hypothetical protein